MWQLGWAICLDNWLNIILNGSESRSVMSNSLQHHGLHSSWNSPDQNTGVGSLPLLQGIFTTQKSNPGLPHCKRILHLSHKGSPRILQWVAYPFSSGSSRPRNQTMVSYMAGRFYTNWAIKEDLPIYLFIWLRSFIKYICLTCYYTHNFRDTFNFLFLYYSKFYGSDSVFFFLILSSR